MANFRKQHLGFIFQDYSVLPTLTVKENIMLPLSVQKFHKYEMEQNYKEVAEALGIYNLEINIQVKFLAVSNNVRRLPEHSSINQRSFRR